MSKRSRITKWKKVREKGKKHYILYYGIFGWGISTGVLFFLLGQAYEYKLNFSEYFSGDWMVTLIISLVSFMLGGILFGIYSWGANENYYHDKYINT
ncbi:hypothetical protein [Bacillus sp. P14.5]|uniref:hypothetical protein n=1 Tax=Bacillus sp. P14.5 TaxID=1983400 RepID=UPI000DE8135D|nr:hypothetical protein [Bacillus sp. P14.5]